MAGIARRRVVFTDAADFLLSFPLFFLIVGLQSPGNIVSDTKYDLAVNPQNFLARSLNLWTDQSFAGQVQNQSYGYFFPQGAFFAAAQWLHIPAWLSERTWWALALTIGFTGLLRLARSLGIGGPRARIVGAIAYVGTPKVLVSLGTISSEIWPMMLAPWVLLAIHAGLSSRMTPRRAAAGAALAVALMGAVNAVATAAACLPAVLWLATARIGRTWWKVTAWWAGLSVLVCLWWAVPLVLLGQVAPPFLDYIESAGVTSRWASLTEALRGTSYWVPFVSPEIPANTPLITTVAVIVATVVVAVAGLAGLAWPARAASSPRQVGACAHRGRLIVMAIIGMFLLTSAYMIPGANAFAAASPLASLAHAFLDGPGAPLRNMHKFEPVLRLPLVLGMVYLLSRACAVAGDDAVGVPLWRRLGHVERYPGLAAAAVVLTALVVSLAPVWRGELAGNGPHAAPAEHWQQAAQWLARNAPDQRALIAPAAPFGVQVWGTSRDEPLQPLAASPWTVRDAIPLQPAPAIRAADAVQRAFDAGRPAPGLATTLAQQGISYVVLRADLRADATTTRPAVVDRVLRESGGFTEVASFGEPIGAQPVVGAEATATVDASMRPPLPPIQIFHVQPAEGLAPYTVPVNQVPVVAGGPEALERIDAMAAARLGPDVPATTRLLAADVQAAQATGIASAGGIIGTDTPTSRETDFGRVRLASSALRDPDALRHTLNPAADYAAAITPDTEPARTELRWRGGRITASSSAAQTSQVGEVRVGQSVAALADGDPRTAWHSRTGEGAFGQQVRIDLDRTRSALTVELTTPATSVGSPVNRVSVRTARGSVVASLKPGTPQVVALPPGDTSWVEITATGTAAGTRGTEFALSEVQLHADGIDVLPRPEVVVPPDLAAPDLTAPDLAAPDSATPPLVGWLFGTDYPGRPACLPTDAQVACAADAALDPEEPGVFARTFTSPSAAQMRPVLALQARPGPQLTALLAETARDAGELSASGDAAVDDPLGGPLAAVDGDPRTAWHAPRPSASNTSTPDSSVNPDSPPTLTVTLPTTSLLGGVRIWPPPPGAGGVPERLELRFGGRTLEVDLRDHDPLPDGSWLLDLPFTRTDTLTIAVLSASNVRDSANPTVALPPAIGDVRLLGADSSALAPPFGASNPLVNLSCTAGPTVSLGDVSSPQSTTRMALRGAINDIRRGAPLLAAPCDGPLTVGSGTQRVQVDPGHEWTVQALELRAVDAQTAAAGIGPAGALGAPPAPATPPAPDTALAPVSLGTPRQTRGEVDVRQWTPEHRELVLTQNVPETGSLLVIPQSFNPGWHASVRTADGATQSLTPIAVGGWQQGWLIPAGTPPGTPVELTFPLNTPYRVALGTGPVALLVVLWLWLARGREHAGAPSRGRRGGPRAWLVGGAVATALLGGLPGIALFGVAVAAQARIPRIPRLAALRQLRVTTPLVPRTAAPILVGAFGIAAGIVLARAPWPSPNYGGDTWWPQLCALSAVAVLLARTALDAGTAAETEAPTGCCVQPQLT